MTWRLAALPAFLPLIALFACEHAPPTEVVPTHGAMLDSAYLSLVDGAAPPCCTVDSAGARVTTLGGALTFYRSLNYTDSVFVPAGWMVPAACVREVPSGTTIVGYTGLLVFQDGSVHMLFPCGLGVYVLTLTQKYSYPDGTARTSSQVVSTGTFSQDVDTLALTDYATPALLFTTTSDSTITVTSPWHQYRFELPCKGWCATMTVTGR
ncbi:MAG TPA: hypothetical protein VMT21_08735 [Gemmatimonadales bacterium]|nr:hypothetical protein [Gemmatimonadales bacterium]